MELVRSNHTKAKIRESLSETRARRHTQVCRVFELKVSIRHNPKDVFTKLAQCFKEAKWVINDMLSFSKKSEDTSLFDYKYTEHKTVIHYDKDKNPVESPITLPSVLHRATVAQKRADLANLTKSKKKGFKVGALKFKSEVNCIPIITGYTQILDGCRITIPGFRRLRVHGLNQLQQFEKFEIADAKLVRKASGYYVKVSVMLPKSKRIPTNKQVGLDFGIKDSITTSYGDKYKCDVRETDYLKFLSRKLNKRGVGKNEKKSKRYYKCMRQLRREYEKLANKRKDIANKIYHKLTTDYDVIYFQDEQIKSWQKGLFGKQVQSSCLGSLKQRLVALEASGRSFKISKWEPTTNLCPVCGSINHPTLADRTYKCSCGYTLDRDTHSARVVLMIGSSKRAERLEQTSVEGVAPMPASDSVAHANPLIRK
ncbi:MAG: transposase [Clostridia bacterium]|nr:transposase [Clostridia bacterium]